MAKWKCEICNSEFDNFQAQGFNHKIYCPLCYFKELYSQTEFERERLKNIIDELEKDLKTLWNICWNNDIEMTSYQSEIFDKYYDKFHKKELKEGKQ